MPGYDYDDELQQCINSCQHHAQSNFDGPQSTQESYDDLMCDPQQSAVDDSAISSWNDGGFYDSAASPGLAGGSIADWGQRMPAQDKDDPWSGGGIDFGIVPDVADVALSKPLLGGVISEGAEEIAGGAEASGALGIVTGPWGAYNGYHEFTEGVESGNVNQATQGYLGTLAGTASTVEGGATILAYGLGDSAAAATVGGVAADMGCVAPPLAAVAGGVAIGTSMAHVADSNATKTGMWGQDAGGNNQSAMDWGASAGTWVDENLGDGQPSVMGGIAAGLGGIAGGVAGTAQVAGQGIESMWDWLTDD